MANATDYTKTDLAKALAKKEEITIKEATARIDSVTGIVEDCLSEGGKVTILGFGTFNISERSAREGRNPKTGEKLQIAATKVVSFKAGKGLKDSVNSK